MTKREYNGWYNYETWLVKLWMDNDQGSQDFWQEQSEMAWRDSAADPVYSMSHQDKARILLAKLLQDNHEEAVYDSIPENMHASFIMDLLNGALSEVNWDEIADSLLTDHVEDYSKIEEAA